MPGIKSTKLPINQKLLIRLFSKVKVSTENFYKGVACWEWQAYCNKDGYARLNIGSRRIPGSRYQAQAHRVFYETFVEEVSPDLLCDHLCRNRRCVNPVHIEPVTSQENTLRGVGPTAVNAQKDFCDAGHPLTEENLYHFQGGRHCKICWQRRSREYKQSLSDDSPVKLKRMAKAREHEMEKYAELMKLPFDHPKRVRRRQIRNECYRRQQERKKISNEG